MIFELRPEDQEVSHTLTYIPSYWRKSFPAEGRVNVKNLMPKNANMLEGYTNHGVAVQ